MRIREATLADASGIAAVIHSLVELQAVAGQSAERTAKTVALNLERMITGGGSTAYVVEAAEGNIVGYAAVHWVPFVFLDGGEAYVTELFISPVASGRGAGSRLLEMIVGEGKSRGCARVSLLNNRDRDSYRRGFYKNRGWIEREGMANFIFPIPKALV